MGDTGDDFSALKEMTKERRANRLATACVDGWQQHTPYHWHRTINGKKLNYWPSSGLVMIGNKKHNIKSKFIRDLLSAGKGGGE